MKLTNPTDDELNAAFAEKVAGWIAPTSESPYTESSSVGCPQVNLDFYWKDNRGLCCDGPRFTTSADAVLPWLEKWHDADAQNRDVRICRRLAGDWLVTLRTRTNPWEQWVDQWEEDGDFPRAAVIALLRANGVEVEFTDSPQ